MAAVSASQHIPANCEAYGSGLQHDRETLDRTGVVTPSRLYAPYGASRYSSGSFPTSVGYTGQRADSSTNLYYYGARYYDPTLAQFTSANTVMDGLNRYGYVKGNPTSRIDPSGHMSDYKEEGGGTAAGLLVVETVNGTTDSLNGLTIWWPTIRAAHAKL